MTPVMSSMTNSSYNSRPQTQKGRTLQMTRRVFALAGLALLLVLSTLFNTGAASTQTQITDRKDRTSQSNASPLETTVAPVSCGSGCVQNLSFCRNSCNGNSTCLAQCQAEYECCQIMCHGGSCRRPQSNRASTMNKAP